MVFIRSLIYIIIVEIIFNEIYNRLMNKYKIKKNDKNL